MRQRKELEDVEREASQKEYEAFITYADTYPDNCILLVDTYDAFRSAIPNAIKTARYLREKGHELKGIRIDSGDLAYLSKEAKRIFIEAGFPDVEIYLPKGLTELSIKEIKKQGLVIDSIGIGDNVREKHVHDEPTVMENRQQCIDQMLTTYPEIKQGERTHTYFVDLARKLLNQKKELIKQAKEQRIDYDENPQTLRKA